MDVDRHLPPVALRLAAVDLQCRWAEAIDARDWPAVVACFTPDVQSELPRTGVSDGVDELLARQRPVLDRLELTHHLLSNHRVAIDDGLLVATCSVVARHERAGQTGRSSYTFGGRYTDHLVGDEDSLRIAKRRLEVVWADGDPSGLRP